MGKWKITVIYGKEASRYADENGVPETVKALDSGELPEGMHATYELDTEADAYQLLSAIGDAWGWDESWYDIELGEDGKWKPKFVE